MVVEEWDILLAPVPQMNGGSGGGATCSPTPYAGGTENIDPNHPQVQGYAGGGTPSYGSPQNTVAVVEQVE